MKATRTTYRSIVTIMAAIVLTWTTSDVVLSGEVLHPTESQQHRDARMSWWRDARFGMFIHWGVYAQLGGEYQGQRTDRSGKDRIGEWIKAWAGIPSDQYDKLLQGFYPVHYDPDAWVRLAKKAGMKYLVITAKHHDGFCLYDSGVTEYDVVDGTPYGKDLLAPLAKACKKHDVQLCFYYSIMDWHHPTQAADPNRTGEADHGLRFPVMLPGRKAEYVKYMKAQLEELIVNYDPAVLWFDGEWVDWWTLEDGKDLYAFCRSKKPTILVNNRVANTREGMEGFSQKEDAPGDFGTPEQQIPATGLAGVDWESCMTMNDTWGYKFYDHNWKSSETLIRNLVDTASKGGNYLLNIGPTPDGRIPEESIKRLSDIGRWMEVNHESIHGTTASPFDELPWGRCTQKKEKLYLHVFDWPQGSLDVPMPENEIQRAYLSYLLAEPNHNLGIEKMDRILRITLPKRAPDKIDSVLVLEMEDRN